ncbi:MAG: hypothetical protein HY581_09405 [Nitrospirae bacterium]|nr:hypothetical protein [Nitrospirota bacterium]
MSSQSAVPSHIEVTETLVRLYVFLAQYLDRCHDEAARQSFPEKELQAHLTTTRARMMDILSVNRVVRDKVEKECDRVLSLGAACLKGRSAKTAVQKELKAERGILQNKMIALSDLLAVFRAM